MQQKLATQPRSHSSLDATRASGLGRLGVLPNELIANEIFARAEDEDLFIKLSSVSRYMKSVSHDAATDALRAKCNARIERSCTFYSKNFSARFVESVESHERTVYFAAAEKYFDRLERLETHEHLASFDQTVQPYHRKAVASKASEKWPKSPYFAHEAYLTSSLLGKPSIRFMNRAVALRALGAQEVNDDLSAINRLVIADNLQNSIFFLQSYGRNIGLLAAWFAHNGHVNFGLDAIGRILGSALSQFDVSGFCINPQAVYKLCLFADSIVPTKNAWMLRAALAFTERSSVWSTVWSVMDEIYTLSTRGPHLPLYLFIHEDGQSTCTGAEPLLSILTHNAFLREARSVRFHLGILNDDA